MAVLLCPCPADLAEPTKAMLWRGTRVCIQAQHLHSGWQEVSNWIPCAMRSWVSNSRDSRECQGASCRAAVGHQPAELTW